jgi:hypothetical protein
MTKVYGAFAVHALKKMKSKYGHENTLKNKEMGYAIYKAKGARG